MTATPRPAAISRILAWALPVLSLGIASILPAAAGGAGAVTAREPVITCRLAIDQRLFSDINRNDVTAAMKAWLNVVERVNHRRLGASVEIARDGDDFRGRIREKTVDLLVLDMWDYLPLADAGLAEAVAIESSGNGPPTYSFEPIEETSRTSSCVLSVFFGKAGAWVVDEINWGILRELNLQLGSAPTVLALSPKILEGTVAMPLEPRHPQRDRLIGSLTNLHQDAGGQQILMLFRSGPLIRPDPAVVAATREFWRQYVRATDPSERGWPHDAPGPVPAATKGAAP